MGLGRRAKGEGRGEPRRGEPAGAEPGRGEPAGAEPAGAERTKPSAADKAAQLLGLRPHFRRELEVKLARAAYDREEIRAALDQLAGWRLLDDAALARSFVETVARRKGWGRTRVVQELARRGAPAAAIDAALAGQSGADDLETAREAARRWRVRGRGDAAGLARHLARRGFGRSAIFKVLNEMALPTSSDEEAPAPDE